MTSIIGKLALRASLLMLSIGLFVGVQAQSSTTGNINGSVRDQKGAAVARAMVMIDEVTNGFSRTVETDSNGNFSAPSLPFGKYSVSTSPAGFKKTVNSDLELHVNQNLVVNLVVEVGEVSETVTVSGETQQVETRSGDVSSLVSEKQVTELPLNGRNYAALVTMIPGVSPVTQNGAGGAFGTRGTGLDSHVDMSVNGNGSNQNLWTVDGVNNMDVGSNATLLVFPSIDSIQEFRVERNSFSAEYGQAQGAVINLITKGGGNQFHGALFDFIRNDKLNANDAFVKSAGQAKPKLRYQNFGGNFSGPIVKNRAFFFWSEEWRREKRGSTPSVQRVPTAAEKVGDFSGQLTDPLPIDPLTGMPFPGNKIPTGRLSPAGLALLKIYPDPNLGLGNWIGAPVQPISTRQDSIRGDVNITSKMNLMVRWIKEGWTHGEASGNFWGDSPFPTLSSDWDQPSRSFAVRLTNTINSTSVNDFQFSRAGNDIFITTSAKTKALDDEIGSKFPTVFPRQAGFNTPTFWGADGYPALWHEAPWTNHEDLFIWKDDFSKVVGNSDLKFGALFSHNIKNEQSTGTNGVYQFCGTNSRTGNAIADLLVKDLPLGCYAELDHAEVALGRWHDLEFYGNDTWKVRKNLTLNLGLRWSRFALGYSANNHISNYFPQLYDGRNPLSGLVTAGTAGFDRSLVKPYNKGFQPRLGLAWDVFGDGKTALRIGFGRYLGRTNVIEDLNRMAGNPPWTKSVSSNWGGSSSRLSDDPTFRSLDTINPGLKNNVAGVGSNTPFNAVSENFRPPESWQWNLTVSREVMKNTVAEVSYIGNKGMHIWRRAVPFNDVVPGARLAIAQAIRNGGDPTPLVDANRRFRGLGPVTMSESTGESRYHSLQVWVNRRFSDRLAFQGAYTWAHTISNVALTSFTNATTDPYNYNLDRGDADLDRRQTFTANAVYVLPMFKKWGNVASKVLGDWQLNGILSIYGGAPLDINSGANTLGLASLANTGVRPNLVTGAPIYLRNSGDKLQWLNPAAFALPGVGQAGSLGRGTVRMPATKNIDFSVAKNWRFKERYGLQFRTEMFNVFNHVNYNGIDTGLAFDNVAKFAGDPCNGKAIIPAGNPNAGQVSACGKSLNGNFGRLNHDNGAREIQFGLKFTF